MLPALSQLELELLNYVGLVAAGWLLVLDFECEAVEPRLESCVFVFQNIELHFEVVQLVREVVWLKESSVGGGLLERELAAGLREDVFWKPFCGLGSRL